MTIFFISEYLFRRLWRAQLLIEWLFFFFNFKIAQHLVPCYALKLVVLCYGECYNILTVSRTYRNSGTIWQYKVIVSNKICRSAFL